MKTRIIHLFLCSFFVFTGFFSLAQENKAEEAPTQKTYRNKGFFISAETAYLKSFSTSSEYAWYSTQDWTLNGNSVRAYVGYFIIPYVSAGLGAGIDNYKAPDALTYPVFFDLRVYLKAQGSSPYAFFDIGKSFKQNDTKQEGLMLDAGVGYKIVVWKKLAVLAAVNYNYKYFPDWWSFNDHIASWQYLKRHSVAFRVGLFF